MTLIHRCADCGNSPKNGAAENLAIALEGGPWLDAMIDAGTVWRRPDGSVVRGEAAIRDARTLSPTTITVDHVATHGKVGAVAGQTDQALFVHVITFATAAAKVAASINSFTKTGPEHG